MLRNLLISRDIGVPGSSIGPGGPVEWLKKAGLDTPALRYHHQLVRH